MRSETAGEGRVMDILGLPLGCIRQFVLADGSRIWGEVEHLAVTGADLAPVVVRIRTATGVVRLPWVGIVAITEADEPAALLAKVRALVGEWDRHTDSDEAWYFLDLIADALGVEQVKRSTGKARRTA